MVYIALRHSLFYYVLLRKNESVNNKILHIIMNIWSRIITVIQDYNKVERGMMDSLLRPFTVSKYGNEMHSRSLDPKRFIQGYVYNGPKLKFCYVKS